MNILYTVCFNEQIFDQTGYECIHSFLKKRVEGDLFIGYEGGDRVKDIILYSFGDQLILYDLDKDDILNKVLKDNADVIPTELGGDNKSMDTGGVGPVGLGASRYFKYRASSWWRVFATLYAASKQPDYDVIVQIDADVAFIKPISIDKIKEEVGDNAVCYHEGPFRRNKVEEGLKSIGVETSFTCYSKDHGGYDVIHKLMDKLITKDFRNYPRWDDSFLLSEIIHNEVEFKCRDLSENDGTHDSNVVDRGPFRDYIRHFKGLNAGSPDGVNKYNQYLKEFK